MFAVLLSCLQIPATSQCSSNLPVHSSARRHAAINHLQHLLDRRLSRHPHIRQRIERRHDTQRHPRLRTPRFHSGRIRDHLLLISRRRAKCTSNPNPQAVQRDSSVRQCCACDAQSTRQRSLDAWALALQDEKPYVGNALWMVGEMQAECREERLSEEVREMWWFGVLSSRHQCPFQL